MAYIQSILAHFELFDASSYISGIPFITTSLIIYVGRDILDVIITQFSTESWHGVLSVGDLIDDWGLFKSTVQVFNEGIFLKSFFVLNNILTSLMASRAVALENQLTSPDIGCHGLLRGGSNCHGCNRGNGGSSCLFELWLLSNLCAHFWCLHSLNCWSWGHKLREEIVFNWSCCDWDMVWHLLELTCWHGWTHWASREIFSYYSWRTVLMLSHLRGSMDFVDDNWGFGEKSLLDIFLLKHWKI